MLEYGKWKTEPEADGVVSVVCPTLCMHIRKCQTTSRFSGHTDDDNDDDDDDVDRDDDDDDDDGSGDRWRRHP